MVMPDPRFLSLLRRWRPVRRSLVRFYGSSRGEGKPRFPLWFWLPTRATTILTTGARRCCLGLSRVFPFRDPSIELILDGQKVAEETVEAGLVHGPDGEGKLKDLLKI